MELQVLSQAFTVCKLTGSSGVDPLCEFCFLGKTDEELSLVCPTEYVPSETLAREDGWRGFRIRGVLDFSLVGILAGIASLLAEHGISIFAVSTFNTDYVFSRTADFDRAVSWLGEAGYQIV
ncbi:MAG: ACT domain-containing protein [Clostridiales bacterium]|nr:ACT domain-containing protein [Clostridiales bacterium]